jgi:hypothetical protein
MKKYLLVLLGFLFVFTVFSQEETKSLYSGGMLILQPGMTITGNDHQDIRHLSTAIGGILRLYFYDYWTAGLYGGSQKTNYPTAGSQNSYLNLGYGGAFFGYSQQIHKFRFTASLFAGMGAISNLHVSNQMDNQLTDADLYKVSTFLYSPILSVDYALSRRIYLTGQVVCLTGKYNASPFYNPVFQLGLLFSR